MGKIIENYSLQALVGEGMYGRVYKGINIKTKEEVAIKVIKAAKFRQIPKLEECTVNEINTLSSISDNQHIVKYIDMLKTVNNFYFVYEFCNGGTLEKLIHTYKSGPEGAMPESQALVYFRQTLKAFKTLTKYNIMHRDLKPGNILLHNGVIKIADFGFCKSLTGPDDLVQTMLGSPIYMAPEVLKGETYTMKADIWSLGVVLYQMLTGECPYQSNSIAKLIQILDSQEVHIPKAVNPTFEKLLRRMLVKDPSKRIDWVELFEFKLPDFTELQLNKKLSNRSTNASTNKIQSMASSADSTTNVSRENFMKVPSKSITSNCNRDQNTRRRSPISSQYPNTLAPSLRTVGTNPSRTYLSKSPFGQGDNFEFNISTYINTHKKTLQLNKLSIEVIGKGGSESLIVSFLLAKGTQAELTDIVNSINKELDKKGISSSNVCQYNQIKKTILSEVQFTDNLMRMYRQELEKIGEAGKFSSVPAQTRNRYIKSYVKTLQFQKQDSTQLLVHASQILDYFEDGILLKKESYQRLSKEQLSRQIHSKMSKLS